ncbi:hypothetical protein BDB00DRAFT_783411 [Zychaea mexicana]|uniref:uncharacterized protein n=1 Tax=Zychaea mexicana TaxID=64656 RepID=UPI0022FEB64E|nr:uncharacterized protein BDB00DRAFT_783411 [Zychaea mexicana]KAI9499349.1 hypothetical protein BDB00DRAFT_783411 [Zychaea mexicana]
MPPIATTHNIVALADRDSTTSSSVIQRDFTSALPYDIVSTIFSHVTKSDCLKCMSVSRKWLSHVPQYTSDLWQEVTISSLEALNNDLLMRCLGPHLKKLRLRRLNESEIGMVIHGLVQKSRCDSIRSVGN